MKIITREQWGAKHGDGRFEALLPATSVWLHHTVTVAPDLEWVDADGDRVDDSEAAAMRHIEGIGAQRFGAAYGFPYSLAVMPRGKALYEGHAIEQQGAHTYGYNHTGRAIVLVGNYEKHKPTDAQLDAVAWGLVEGKRRGWWKKAELSGGHRDVKATACPGKYAYEAIPEINRRARALESGEEDMPGFDDRFKLSEGQNADIPGSLNTISFGAALGYGTAAYFLAKQLAKDLAHVHNNVHMMNEKLNWLVENAKKQTGE
jgi:hypothetical protein